MNKNYQFFMKMPTEHYIGEWVAICNRKVISHGKDVKKVFRQAKEKCPQQTPLVTWVPDKETMIF